MKYTVVSAKYNYIALADKVNKLVAEGWMPIGGVAVESREFTFYQAMFLYELQEKSPNTQDTKDES